MTPRMEAAAVSAESQPTSALTVESVGTHVYFYSGVDSDRCLALIKELRGIDNMLSSERIARNVPPGTDSAPIWLHIMSCGGDIFAALSVADQIKTLSTPVYSVVEGYTASAATIISMACTRRFIMPSAFFLIHQLSTIQWGTYTELQDDMHILDMLMETITKFYAKHSKLSRKRIAKLLRRDSWFNATQALGSGFVDSVGV